MSSAAPRRAPRAGHPGADDGRLAHWAVAGSAASGTAFASSVAAIAAAYALGEQSAFEDTVLGSGVALIGLGGLLGALVAFALGLVGLSRRVRASQLWLPLCVFPAMLLFLLLGEAFWWE